MQLERRSFEFDIRKKSDDGSEFDGYASCFYNMDSYGSLFARGAWTEDLPRFLARGVVLWQHDTDVPIGRPTDAQEDERGLLVGARISDTAAGRDARTLIKDGVVQQLSVGFTTKTQEWLDTPDEVAEFWRDQGYKPSADDVAASKYGARVIKRAKLYEFSPVSFAANGMCDITDVRAEPPAGIRLDDQVSAALAAVTELADRARSLHDRRHSEGRTLSDVRIGQIGSVSRALIELLDQLTPQTTASEETAPEAQREAGLTPEQRFRVLSLRADALRRTL
jgi:uncharacterized protein